MFTWKQILCILIFSLIFSLIVTKISCILRKKLIPEGKDPFLPSSIIFLILWVLTDAILYVLLHVL